MGIVVGSHDTSVECDRCRRRSTPSYDQQRAREQAQREGFAISPTTGLATCHTCRCEAGRLCVPQPDARKL